MRQRGYQVLTTREPGGTPIGDQIRDVLHSLDNTAMHPRTESLFFQAARAQLVEQVICPHLASGGIVISDRYADSTLAYQGYGHGLPLEQVQAIINFATGGLKPDLTLLLDLEVELGLRRKVKGGEWNRLDAYDVEFHRRVRHGYHQLMQAEPQRWVIVDAAQETAQVQAELRRVVMEKLGCGQLEIIAHPPHTAQISTPLAPELWQGLLDLFRALTFFQAVDHLVKFWPDIVTHFAAHLVFHFAHHPTQGAGIILQPFQAGGIGQIFHAAVLGAGKTYPAHPALDLIASAMGASYRLLAVFAVSHKYFKTAFTIQATILVGWHMLFSG